MEATLSQCSSVNLIGELVLTIAGIPRANYILARNNITSYCPQNVINHVGTNVMQFVLADSSIWLDPQINRNKH